MAWTLLGTAAARGAMLVAALVVARVLGPVSFGELGVIESSVGMFAVLANLGLSLTSMKFVAKYRHTDPNRAGRVLGLCCAFALASSTAIGAGVWLAAPWLAAVTLEAPHLGGALRLSTALLIFSSLNGALSGALIGFQAFKQVALLNVVLGVVTIPLLAGSAMAGLPAVVMGLVAVQAISTCLHAAALRAAALESGVTMTFRRCWVERELLTSFSLPALISSSLRSPVNWLCMALLVNQAGGYAEMGLLHAANPWFLLLMFLPGQLANVYFPMVEDALARRNADEARRLVLKSMQLNIAVCSVLAAAIAVWSETLLGWCGEAYRDGVWALRASAATGLVIAFQQPLSAYLVSAANMWLLAACSALWAAVFIAASYWLLPYGASGIATARLVAYGVYAVVVAWLAWPHLRQVSAAATNHIDSEAQAKLRLSRLAG